MVVSLCRFARATAATFGLGIFFFPTNTQCDDHTSSSAPKKYPTSTWWLHWLVNSGDQNYGTVTGSSGYRTDDGGLKAPELSPGKVLAWGGVFGRSPKVLEELGSRIMRVAVAANGLGAAIDADGRAVVFAHDVSEGMAVQPVELPAPASLVAWLESKDEAVFVDTSGTAHVTTVQCASSNRKMHHEQLVLSGPAEIDNTHSLNQQSNSEVRNRVFTGPVRRVDLACHKGRGQPRVVDLSCGTAHCAAVAANGVAFAWGGDNSHGQLGTVLVSAPSTVDEGMRDTATEMEVPDDSSGVVAVACGDAHTLLLANNGHLYATGADGWAQLGREAQPWLIDKSERLSILPREATLFGDLVGRSVAAGAKHSAFLVRDGTLFTCGFNQYGQLGHHNYTTFAPPSPVADVTLRAVEVSAAGNHTCVISDNGILRCIGANDSGQLGTGSLQPSATWRKIRFNKKSLRPSYVHTTSRATAVIIPADKWHW